MMKRRKLPGLDSPVVLLGKGGSGSRLLSQLALDGGVALGCNLNSSLDSLDFVDVVYNAVTRKLSHKGRYSASTVEKGLRAAASQIVSSLPHDDRSAWGFKLPECLFLLPEINAAFPRARYAVLFRDPLSASLRRTHVTSRMDSAVGRAALTASYIHCGLDPMTIASDPIEVHNACALAYQIELLMDFVDDLKGDAARVFITFFEDLVRDPSLELEAFANWLGRPLASECGLTRVANQSRASNVSLFAEATSGTLALVSRILGPAIRRQAELAASLPERM
jgi:hypothetical protein